jgi:hypothetical protein
MYIKLHAVGSFIYKARFSSQAKILNRGHISHTKLLFIDMIWPVAILVVWLSAMPKRSLRIIGSDFANNITTISIRC